MRAAEKLSLEAMGWLVEASDRIRFEGADRHQVYGWMERLLVQQEYALQGKAERGLQRAAVDADRRRVIEYNQLLSAGMKGVQA